MSTRILAAVLTLILIFVIIGIEILCAMVKWFFPILGFCLLFWAGYTVVYDEVKRWW